MMQEVAAGESKGKLQMFLSLMGVRDGYLLFLKGLAWVRRFLSLALLNQKQILVSGKQRQHNRRETYYSWKEGLILPSKRKCSLSRDYTNER